MAQEPLRITSRVDRGVTVTHRHTACPKELPLFPQTSDASGWHLLGPWLYFRGRKVHKRVVLRYSVQFAGSRNELYAQKIKAMVTVDL